MQIGGATICRHELVGESLRSDTDKHIVVSVFAVVGLVGISIMANKAI